MGARSSAIASKSTNQYAAEANATPVAAATGTQRRRHRRER
jgi:hypothetical protein